MTQTTAYYNGIKLCIIKAETENEVIRVFENQYEFPFPSGTFGSRHKTKAFGWLTFEASEISGFYWLSGIWMFGIKAEDATTRDQAVEEFVSELRGFS